MRERERARERVSDMPFALGDMNDFHARTSTDAVRNAVVDTVGCVYAVQWGEWGKRRRQGGEETRQEEKKSKRARKLLNHQRQVAFFRVFPRFYPHSLLTHSLSHVVVVGRRLGLSSVALHPVFCVHSTTHLWEKG